MPKIIDHDAVQAKICQQLMTGSSLREICRQKDMPGLETVMGWLRVNPVFSVQYAQAREAQAEMMADRMIEIALNPPKNVDPAVLRAQMEAIKWAAGKMKPAKYGADQLLRRRADDDYEREIINITPEPDGGDVPRLDKKQLARVIWHTLMNGEETDDEAN
jgi:hypothetical protein